MNADKRKALEAAGWKFGSADEFLGERPMSDSDKIRAEFEAWSKSEGLDTATITFFSCGQHKHYVRPETAIAFRAYQAGRKAEREEMQLKNWDGIRLGSTGKPEETNERG